MSEWWNYRPSDFLLFSPRTYYRLIELYNIDIWPLQIVALFAGAAIFLLMLRPNAWSGRAIATILATCWLCIAWAFHWQRYATINWAATYIAIAFAVEALLLIWIGIVRDRLDFGTDHRTRARLGATLVLFALIAQPLLGLLMSREWQQLDVFGVTPDPTAVATLGVLLGAKRFSWAAAPIPVLWCLLAGMTLWLLSTR